MAHQRDFIGKKYGHITILSLAKYKDRVLYVLARCDCGIENVYILEDIERGKIKSCGCMKHKDSPIFAENVDKRIKDLIEINGECWIWKGLYRKNQYQTPYVNIHGLQINPVKYLANDDWKAPNRNLLYICQCETPLCVNPDHHVRVGRSEIHKALKKEVLCEYLKRKQS